jgi:uncharacterized protein (DUF1501 family)
LASVWGILFGSNKSVALVLSSKKHRFQRFLNQEVLETSHFWVVFLHSGWLGRLI